MNISIILKGVKKTKNLIFISALLFTGNMAEAQQIAWAEKVVKFSSETGTKAYSASQILGKPNAKPDSAGNAWRPNSQGKHVAPEIAAGCEVEGTPL